MRDPAVHAAVLDEVAAFIAQSTRLYVAGLTWSPILGPEGNMEFLCWLTREARELSVDIGALVGEAHLALRPGRASAE